MTSQDFAYDVTMRMRERFMMQEMWHRLDIGRDEATRLRRRPRANRGTHAKRGGVERAIAMLAPRRPNSK